MKKRFDAVEFQRKAREELSKRYCADPEAFVRELQEKYGRPREPKQSATAKQRG